jgi:hypothetical protein
MTSTQREYSFDSSLFGGLSRWRSPQKRPSHGAERTLRASSTIPFIIFVHVKCNTVSIPYPVCVSSASSRLRSFVDPPAPQVILIAIGLRAERRSIRVIRFSNPYGGMLSSWDIDKRKDRLDLICSWRKELECVEWPRRVVSFDFFGQFH